MGLVKKIHKVLTGGTYDERRYIDNEERPGEFKKHDYVTGVHLDKLSAMKCDEMIG